jgi:hypothetical protein
MSHGVMEKSRDSIIRHEFDKRLKSFCSVPFTASSTGGFYRELYKRIRLTRKLESVHE